MKEHYAELDALRPTATFEDVEVCRVTERGILLYIPDQCCGRRAIGEVWAPLAIVDRQSEVPRVSRGYLIVDRWYAEKHGWVS